MDALTRHYPESRFGGFSDVDGTMIFYSRVKALVDSRSRVLDVGCGRGAYGEDPIPARRDLRILRGRVARVTGLDVDPQASTNPFIDEFRLLDGDRWPIESESIDLVLSDWTLEHVRDPRAFFSECHRVLVRGGVFCGRTANRWGYVACIASLVPNRHHRYVLTTAQPGRKAADIFPTVYACNTIPKLRRFLGTAGFDHCVYGYEAEPRYLEFSRGAYLLGVLYQRWAPRLLRNALFAFARKSA